MTPPALGLTAIAGLWMFLGNPPSVEPQPPSEPGIPAATASRPVSVCAHAGIAPGALLVAGLSPTDSLTVISRAADPLISPLAYRDAARSLADARARHQLLVDRSVRSPLDQQLRSQLAQTSLQLQQQAAAAAQARTAIRASLLAGVNETTVATLDRVTPTVRSGLPMSFAAVNLSAADRRSLFQQLNAERRAARDPQFLSRFSEEELAAFAGSGGSTATLAVVRTDPAVRAADESLRTQRAALEISAAAIAPPQP